MNISSHKDTGINASGRDDTGDAGDGSGSTEPRIVSDSLKPTLHPLDSKCGLHDAHDEPNDDPEDTAIDPLAVIEVRDLLTAVYDFSGVDFRNYAYSSLIRRINRRISEEGVVNIAALKKLVCSDTPSMERLLSSLTLPVTSMFRDPAFFLAFRERVCPVLATYPFLRLWVAGCSTGQEVYSLAIVLTELGLYDRCRIYATDLHPGFLRQAQTGIYSLASMQEYTRNYQLAGGSGSFAQHFTTDAENALLNPQLRSNVIFSRHNLVCDTSFNEFHVIFCRNVMIYFNEQLQNRVHRLLYESLCRFGYLGIGRSESIRFSHHEIDYETVSKPERIYRRVN